MFNNKYWMNHAIKLSKESKKNGEIPVGAVLILKNKIIGEGSNCYIKNNDPIYHAEIIAIRQATKKLNNYRLKNTYMYVTLEPCLMCIGAILNSRINNLIFGANNFKINKYKSFYNNIYLNEKINVIQGIFQKKISKQIKNFFIKIRKLNKKL